MRLPASLSGTECKAGFPTIYPSLLILKHIPVVLKVIMNQFVTALHRMLFTIVRSLLCTYNMVHSLNILLLSSKLHLPTKKPAGYKSPMKSVVCILIRNIMIPEIH